MKVLNFIWMFPINYVKSKVFPLSMDSRRRPLHTCGAAVLAVAQNTFTKAQDIDSPLGSIARRSVTLFNMFYPFLYSMFYPWLAMLSFIDDQLLTIESLVEKFFPSSRFYFDKFDAFFHSAEALPEKFDDIWRKLPMMVHQFPSLDWIIVHLISWSSFIVSSLNHVGSKYTKEKEITVDTNSNGIEKSDSLPEVVDASLDHYMKTSNDVRVKELEKPRPFQEKDNDASRNHVETSEDERFGELVKSYLLQEKDNNASKNHMEPSSDVHFEAVEKSEKDKDASRNHFEPSNNVQFDEELKQSYPLQEHGNNASMYDHTGYSNDLDNKEVEKPWLVQEKDNNKTTRNHIEPSIIGLSEVIHKSLRRLHSLEKIKSVDRQNSFTDSPAYGAFRSAVSTPTSDWSQDEINPFTPRCSYKEILKKEPIEDGETTDDDTQHECPKAFINAESAAKYYSK